ncbi:MAG TPA: hypothetical protein PKI40_09890 [Methanomassiliicoccaceae archaeon]|jgi:hypothetical protein|nr:hypothetical protein [Methanomassiliicoccaceae archaeon]
MDQYKFEKALEVLYERQCARVRPEWRDRCGPLQEMRDFLEIVKEGNIEAFTFEMGLPIIRDCDQCGGQCFKSR